MTSSRKAARNDALVELVERLAGDYEAEAGIRPIVIAVRQARDTISLLALEEADGGVALIERVARQQLDLLTGRAEDNARLMPTRRSPRRHLDDRAAAQVPA